MPFAQFFIKWDPVLDEQTGNYIVPVSRLEPASDVVYDITVTGMLRSVRMYTYGRELFLWKADTTPETRITVRVDQTVCTLKLGMTFVKLEIDSLDMPEASSLHVVYLSNSARIYESQHPVVQGYPASSDLWDPVTQTLDMRRVPPSPERWL